MKLKKLFKKKNIEKNIVFWEWFEKKQNKFLFLSDVSEAEKDKLMNELLVELHKFNSELYFQIGGDPKSTKIELVISAEGDSNHFADVELLVSSAPKFSNWNIIAFKQPMGQGCKTIYEGKKFDPKTIIYIPLNSKNNPNSIGINVCYSDFSEENKNLFINGTYQVLDSLIGEKSTTLDIDYINVIKTPENIGEYQFGHLCDIQEYIHSKDSKNEN